GRVDTALAAITHAAAANAEAGTESHGPSRGCVANGGKAMNRTAPAAAATASPARSTRIPGRTSAGRRASAIHPRSPRADAAAASPAHETGETSKLPKNPRTWLLVTAFVQGTAVARNAAANPAPTAGRATRPT